MHVKVQDHMEEPVISMPDVFWGVHQQNVYSSRVVSHFCEDVGWRAGAETENIFAFVIDAGESYPCLTTGWAMERMSAFGSHSLFYTLSWRYKKVWKIGFECQEIFKELINTNVRIGATNNAGWMRIGRVYKYFDIPVGCFRCARCTNWNVEDQREFQDSS